MGRRTRANEYQSRKSPVKTTEGIAPVSPNGKATVVHGMHDDADHVLALSQARKLRKSQSLKLPLPCRHDWKEKPRSAKLRRNWWTKRSLDVSTPNCSVALSSALVPKASKNSFSSGSRRNGRDSRRSCWSK